MSKQGAPSKEKSKSEGHQVDMIFKYIKRGRCGNICRERVPRINHLFREEILSGFLCDGSRKTLSGLLVFACLTCLACLNLGPRLFKEKSRLARLALLYSLYYAHAIHFGSLSITFFLPGFSRRIPSIML